MERRFDMSDFERSLKDHADQFKLMPSKRVWNGIYNNLHPGSKWPSISIAIVFIITLVSIGNLNNSPKRPDANNSVALTKATKASESNQIVNYILTKKDIAEIKGSNGQSPQKNNLNPVVSTSELSNIMGINNSGKSGSVIEKESFSIKHKFEKTASGALDLNVSEKRNYTGLVKELAVELENNSLINEKLHEGKIISVDFNSIELLSNKEEILFSQTTNTFKSVLTAFFFPVFFGGPSSPGTVTLNDNEVNIPSNAEDKADFNSADNTIINNKAKVNTKKIKRKKNKNVEWTFYAAPTMGSVSFNKKRNIAPSSSNVSSIIILPNDPSFGLRRTIKLGFETGAEMNYKISKRFGFITGANISYSGYNNISNLIHPTFASLQFIDKNSGSYSRSYVTNYGNGQSPNRISLTNYSFELSVPLGLKYNIWRNEKIQIDAVSTVDPSVVLKKNAFIISSDGRYYINDPSLVRNVNLAGHLGSYITFSAKKIKWHIGPDVRYQLLSTYKSYYPAREHFIDYGIRIGISR
jgi:hypothetical protein